MTGMAGSSRGSAARLRKEAARSRLLAHNAASQEERERLMAMAAMFEREAQAIEAALRGRD